MTTHVEQDAVWIIKQIHQNGGFLLCIPGELHPTGENHVRLFAPLSLPQWLRDWTQRNPSLLYRVLERLGKSE